MVKAAALKAGAFAAVVCSHWSEGGSGATELAEAVINACKDSKNFKFLYDNEMSLLDKMNTIAQNMYGAAKVELTPKAQSAMEKLTAAVSIYFKLFIQSLLICLTGFSLGFWQFTYLYV